LLSNASCYLKSTDLFQGSPSSSFLSSWSQWIEDENECRILVEQY
jgi:hypothetical protein